ncbi:arylsulfatase precursor [Moniliophthora roreri]|nr:arylsulfatase precursor [Moniliophthora roreri]
MYVATFLSSIYIDYSAHRTSTTLKVITSSRTNHYTQESSDRPVTLYICGTSLQTLEYAYYGRITNIYIPSLILHTQNHGVHLEDLAFARTHWLTPTAISFGPRIKPNIILIITDNQDVRTGTLEYMPKTHKALGEQGTTTLLPFACLVIEGYHLFREKGQNNAYLPIFLQEAGYNTYHTGKLMNGLSSDQMTTGYPKGWTYSEFLVDPNAYFYFNATLSANNSCSGSVNYDSRYQVDVIQEKALGLREDARAVNRRRKDG